MGIQVESGKGDGNIAGVSRDNRLMTVSKSNVRGYYISRDDERLFNATFEDAAAQAGEYIAYLQNTSVTRRMFIDTILLGGIEAITWKLVTATGTATGGTTVTPVNMNRSSGITAEATALAANVGGFTAGTPLITKAYTPANSTYALPIDDVLVLGQNDAIGLEYDAGTTGIASATIRFFYEDL